MIEIKYPYGEACKHCKQAQLAAVRGCSLVSHPVSVEKIGLACAVDGGSTNYPPYGHVSGIVLASETAEKNSMMFDKGEKIYSDRTIEAIVNEAPRFCPQLPKVINTKVDK